MEQLTLPLDELLAEDFERLFTEREDKRRRLDQHVDWLLERDAERVQRESAVASVQHPFPWPLHVLYTSDGRLHVLENEPCPINLLNLR